MSEQSHWRRSSVFVFIVNFEQVNAGWARVGSTDLILKYLCFYIYFEGKLPNSANTFMLFVVLLTPNIYLQILFLSVFVRLSK